MRETFLKETAEELGMPESVVEKIIDFQFKHLAQATKTANSIEIAAIGTFTMSFVRMRRRIRELEKILENLHAQEPKNELKIATTQAKLDILKERIKTENNETKPKRNTRGTEQ